MSIETPRWKNAAIDALYQARPIELPYADSGTVFASSPTAQAYLFEASAGQKLVAKLVPQSFSPSGGKTKPLSSERIFVDLFSVNEKSALKAFHRSDTLQVSDGRISSTIAQTGLHVLRIQPEPFTNYLFALAIELEPELGFPVAYGDLNQVRGFYGDSRANGERSHEGIDIFADKGTDVVAVSDGLAVPGKDEHGGNVVWLYRDSVAYYYAHLDKAARKEPWSAKAGEVLGFVGNTGNARRSPPHLHFSIFQDRSRPVDPLPHFVSSRFNAESEDARINRILAAIEADHTHEPSIDKPPAANYELIVATLASGSRTTVAKYPEPAATRMYSLLSAFEPEVELQQPAAALPGTPVNIAVVAR